MAGYGGAPFGLREVKLYNADGSGALALPAVLMMHVTPTILAETFKANGVVIGASSFITGAEWELEAGGISLEAIAKLTGLTATQVGSTPNRTLTLTGNAETQFPYLRIYGRSVADAGDIHCRMYRCKVTALEGTFRQKEFWVTYVKGVAVDNGSGVLEFVQHETAAAL